MVKVWSQNISGPRVSEWKLLESDGSLSFFTPMFVIFYYALLITAIRLRLYVYASRLKSVDCVTKWFSCPMWSLTTFPRKFIHILFYKTFKDISDVGI